MLDTKTLLTLIVGLLLSGAASGCASNQAANSRGLTGSIDRSASTAARAEDEEEPMRPTPPDPYKGVQYRGGRDPVTGVAPDLDGQLPPPPVVAAPSRKKTARASDAFVATPVAASGLRVQVQAGDTLASIARKHQVSVAALMQINGLSTPKIVVAQTLIIPAK